MPNTYNTNNDNVVGFKKEAKTIINHLIHGSKEREVVLITGMGGLGKTTLARKMYDEKSVDEHFDMCLWCTVSQEYDCKDLLNKIYKDVCGSETEIDNVAEKLRQTLMGLRYLIVLDDIWSLEAWEELNRSFPDCDCGSRIILTSRQEDVISDAKHICHLPFFTTDECWQLLQMKLFKEERCPKERENIGREISKKCGGLPLVVGLVAGLLEKREWEEVLNTLNSHASIRDEIQINDVIELSYKYLSNHLKSCFLYFAAFPEDKEIDTSHMIELWISEGFIDIIGNERLEDKAEDYLNHLVKSNLIMASKVDDDRIVACIIHDLVRDFCLTKAKVENFFHMIKIKNKKNKLDPTLKFAPRRISLHKYSDSEISIKVLPWDSSICTILGFGYGTYNVSWVVEKFKHLTILDLEFKVDKSILHEINSLIHLRHLALDLHGSGYVSPRSLENLKCLVTLKLSSEWELHLPRYFWNMRSLRHMDIFHYCESCSEESTAASVIETIPDSGVLQTLTSSFCLYERDEHLLRKNPDLKNLRCQVSKSPFPEIGFLCHLQSLGLLNFNVLAPIHLLDDLKLSRFPSSIKEIYLLGFTLCLSSISIISQLPNLEALMLRICRTEGLVENVEVEEEIQFPKLKHLEMVETNIWSIINLEEFFPCLERLILTRCDKFELPDTLTYILTLKEILVDNCHPIVNRSADKIQECASEMGYEHLNVKIKPGPLFRDDEPEELSFVDDEPGELSVVDDEPQEPSFMDKPRSWARRFCCLGGGNKQFS